jgi:Tfp pilus assembly pilus retraction ATPase PilT
MAFRAIPFEVPTLESLDLPPVMEQIALSPRGLVLVTGVTGSGKSTTLAAIVRHLNERRAVNIVSVEDPIEFLHRDGKAIISQREVGSDTHSFHDPRADRPGRVPAAEVLVNTAAIAQLIRTGDESQSIPDLIAEGQIQYGMQTFDQSLLELYKRGWISYEWAVHYASNPSEFALRVSGVQPGEQEMDWTPRRAD